MTRRWQLHLLAVFDFLVQFGGRAGDFYCLFINDAVIAQVLSICFIGGHFLQVCILCLISFIGGVCRLYYKRVLKLNINN